MILRFRIITSRPAHWKTRKTNATFPDFSVNLGKNGITCGLDNLRFCSLVGMSHSELKAAGERSMWCWPALTGGAFVELYLQSMDLFMGSFFRSSSKQLVQWRMCGTHAHRHPHMCPWQQIAWECGDIAFYIGLQEQFPRLYLNRVWFCGAGRFIFICVSWTEWLQKSQRSLLQGISPKYLHIHCSFSPTWNYI